MPAADPQSIAERVTALTREIDALTRERKFLLEELLVLHDLGKVDPQLKLPDGWTLQWSAGRQSYDYPADVLSLEAQLKAAKETAVATGRATPMPCSPFWTVRKPREGKA